MVENPTPSLSLEIEPEELQELQKSDSEDFQLVDVRTKEEFEIARIEGASLLNDSLIREISENWPRETRIIFHCHHGVRSLGAARHFIEIGFIRVQSLAGGIEAWSERIDPNVPRY